MSVTVDQLTVDYEKTPALWDISFQASDSELIAIIGPNGAGKSTLLKALLGLVKPTCGKVTFQEGKVISYVPQFQSVDWDFPITVYDLVMMGRFGRLRWFERPKGRDHQHVLQCLERVGLSSVKHRQISELSGGQQSRAFLARALVGDADIYFLDEIYAGIDEASAQVIAEILHELKLKGKTVFVVHHDLEDVKKQFDHVILLNRRLVAAGPVDEVMTTANLHSAYGKENLLFEKVAHLTRQKATGLVQ